MEDSDDDLVWGKIILKRSPFLIFPQYICWREEPIQPLVNHARNYREFTHLSRVLHFEDYRKVFEEETIIPRETTQETHTSLPVGFKGSWFGIPGVEGAHVWYGNVSCEVDFQTLLRDFHWKIYFVEIVEFRTSSAPRILLTTQGIPEGVNVLDYDPRTAGGPWYQHRDGRHFFLCSGPKCDNGDYRDCQTYEMEFLLVLSEEEYKKLYEMCEVRAVNHREANEQGFRRCKKYRSGRRDGTCPSPWAIDKCRAKLEQLRNGRESIVETGGGLASGSGIPRYFPEGEDEDEEEDEIEY